MLCWADVAMRRPARGSFADALRIACQLRAGPMPILANVHAPCRRFACVSPMLCPFPFWRPIPGIRPILAPTFRCYPLCFVLAQNVQLHFPHVHLPRSSERSFPSSISL